MLHLKILKRKFPLLWIQWKGHFNRLSSSKVPFVSPQEAVNCKKKNAPLGGKDVSGAHISFEVLKFSRVETLWLSQT